MKGITLLVVSSGRAGSEVFGEQRSVGDDTSYDDCLRETVR